MTTSRQSIRTLITDLSEVLAWGEAVEDANWRLQNQIAAKDAEIERLKAELSIFKTGGASPGNGET